MTAGMLLLVSQTVMALPALPPGTEVRLVSPDLLTVYASAQVKDGSLAFQVVPPAGTELRLLIFPPDASNSERAATLSGARVISGRINVNGNDILLQFPDSDQPVSLRAVLQERGLTLAMNPGKEP